MLHVLPVSPNSPKMLIKTSASVPLPFTSAVKTLTTNLLSGKLRKSTKKSQFLQSLETNLIYKLLKSMSAANANQILRGFYLCIHTFGYVHGVYAAQQVSDVKAISLYLTEPVITSKIEPQMRSNHIRYHDSVQEPAGIKASVVMLNPGETETCG